MNSPHKGRGSGFNIPNRFEKFHFEPLDIETPSDDDDRTIPTIFYRDTSRTILAKNDSPDLPFTFSINPYRGCEHGCIYCYARPSHEYLGFSAGLDFESKIMIKLDAPRLLEQAMRKKGWEPQMVAFSGNTDCYQPVERELQLTRQCLQVFLKFRNPVGIVTKNALVARDLDILRNMAALELVHVMISITTLDDSLVRRMEPRTSSALIRLRTIEQLASANVPVGVSVAPIIPGLTDQEIPSILKAAANAGASSAGYELLRLPGPVEPLFLQWLNREMPERAAKIINRIRSTRAGKLNDARFGLRMRGEGELAKAIDTLFELNARRYNLEDMWCGMNIRSFRHPSDAQYDLFAE